MGFLSTGSYLWYRFRFVGNSSSCVECEISFVVRRIVGLRFFKKVVVICKYETFLMGRSGSILER